jgi:hypothetical protein
MCCRPAKCRSPTKPLPLPKAREKLTSTQTTLTMAIVTKFCMSMARACFARTMPL